MSTPVSDPDPTQSILIVGAGTFGLSTAFHLARKGYTNVTVLDRSPTLPSAYSAGNDLNKIVRAEYEDEWYTELALDAMKAWSAPFWAPFYRETGYLVATSSEAPKKATQSLQDSLRSLTGPNSRFARDAIVPVTCPDDLRTLVPAVTGPAIGWTGYLNRKAGYVRAAPALKATYDECVSLGVRFVLGSDGHATQLLYDAASGELVAVKTHGSAVFSADVTILSLGAHTASLLPAAGVQITAKAWAVGHVQLTPAECSQLARIPVINCRDIGFLFEPDMDTGLLKIAANGAGYVNHVASSQDKDKRRTSVPLACNVGGIPAEDEARIRQLLREIFPDLAGRPLVHKFICWCADTADSNYIIDNVPGHGGSKRRLIVASGDSGHAFKMLPVVGQWVMDVLEDGEQKIEKWKWKNIGESENGNDISWRVGQVEEIGSKMEWGVDSKRQSKI